MITTYNLVRTSSPSFENRLGIEESKEDLSEERQVQGSRRRRVEPMVQDVESSEGSSMDDDDDDAVEDDVVEDAVEAIPHEEPPLDHPELRSFRTSNRMPAAKKARWEISRLAKSTTAADVRISLRRVLEALELCDGRGLAEVRPALDVAVPEHNPKTFVEGDKRPSSLVRSSSGISSAVQPQKAHSAAWTRENRAFFVSMLLTYYKGDRLSMLPKDVVCGCILAFCDVALLARLASVSRATRTLADSDASWRSAYERTFGGSKAGVTYDYGASLKESYHQRIRDPTEGDRVEVAWQGRFRLEGLEVYRGLAWWAAEVAEKRSDSESDDDLFDDDDDESGGDDDEAAVDDAMAPNGEAPEEEEETAAAADGEDDHLVGLNTAVGSDEEEVSAQVEEEDDDDDENPPEQQNTNEADPPPPPTTTEGTQEPEQEEAPPQRRRRRRDNGEPGRRKSGTARRRYKVHYLNWDARWDEWVSRDQLRWPVQEGKTCAIEPGDDVEVWCSGNTVPGAWLRAVVDQVDDELFCVGNVASSGHLWVSRDRVRLVRRKATDETDETKQRTFSAARFPNCLVLPVHKLRECWGRSGIRSFHNALACVLAPFQRNFDETGSAPETPGGQGSPIETPTAGLDEDHRVRRGSRRSRSNDAAVL